MPDSDPGLHICVAQPEAMHLIETRDKRLLRAFFASAPADHLYQWGDLASPAFERCRWFAALGTGGIRSLLLLFAGLEIPVLLPTGADDGVEALLGHFDSEFPRRYYTKLTDAQERLFETRFRLTEAVGVTVMMLEKLEAHPQPARTLLEVVEPSRPLEPLLRLYEDYPGNYFDRSHLETGLYVSARVNGRLAAVAGTHALSREEGVAVLGNIVTKADFRGRGLCQATTTFLIRQLRKAGCRTIGLHVEDDNAPAIACYRKLGFRVRGRVTQFVAEQAAPETVRH